MEIGKRYGRLTVIKKLDRREHETTVYLCKCDCGNLKEVNVNKLHSGHTKSCGCLKSRIKDLTGMSFGRLKVIKSLGRKNNKTLWLCKCDCGNDCEASSSVLTTGQKVSCGCKNKENQTNVVFKDKTLIDGTRLSSISPTRKINKNNSTGYKGVHFDKSRNKYVAQITFKKESHNLGRYDNIEDAIAARKQAEKELFESVK